MKRKLNWSRATSDHLFWFSDSCNVFLTLYSLQNNFPETTVLRYWYISVSFRPSIFWYPEMVVFVTQFLSVVALLKIKFLSFFFARQSCLASALLVNKHNQIFFQYCIPVCVCWNCSSCEVGSSSCTRLQTGTAIFPFVLSLKIVWTWPTTWVQIWPKFFITGDRYREDHHLFHQKKWIWFLKKKTRITWGSTIFAFWVTLYKGKEILN